MGAFILTFLPLVRSLIQGAEAVFKGKPESGADKMDAVVAGLQLIAEKMFVSKIPLADGSLIGEKTVNDLVLRSVAETEFQKMKAAGQIGQPVAAATTFFCRGVIYPVPGM